MIAIIGSLLSILGPFLGMLIRDMSEDGKRKKEVIQNAEKQIDTALATRDPSALTIGLDALGGV